MIHGEKKLETVVPTTVNESTKEIEFVRSFKLLKKHPRRNHRLPFPLTNTSKSNSTPGVKMSTMPIFRHKKRQTYPESPKITIFRLLRSRVLPLRTFMMVRRVDPDKNNSKMAASRAPATKVGTTY